MGIMVYSLLWVMQDFVHQPYLKPQMPCKESLRLELRARGLKGVGVSAATSAYSEPRKVGTWV